MLLCANIGVIAEGMHATCGRARLLVCCGRVLLDMPWEGVHHVVQGSAARGFQLGGGQVHALFVGWGHELGCKSDAVAIMGKVALECAAQSAHALAWAPLLQLVVGELLVHPGIGGDGHVGVLELEQALEL